MGKNKYKDNYREYDDSDEPVSIKQMVREEYRKKKHTQKKAHDRRKMLRELKEDRYWN